MAKKKTSAPLNAAAPSNGHQGSAPVAVQSSTRTYVIEDYRLEKPAFTMCQSPSDAGVCYQITGDLSAPVPPIRESKYLDKTQSLEIYRWMLLNRRMETALENLYKQGKVVGGVYFGLGQEGCSCASAYALRQEEWLGPMIRNQGSLLVRGFSARDIMMQYMAKAGSPTKGRDASSHFGDIKEHNVVAPISTLGDLIPVMAGVALGARLQGRSIAVMTYIGDGGQSTGVTYEGLNFAAVQNLGLVLFVENNLWGYSTPSDMQFRVKDLAERAIAYGIPGIIVDGTDPNQIYDAAHEACERARRGEGPTLIEAKMMRMKGHAIHDAAEYVPKPLFEYWKKRDCIARYENYLVNVKQWLTPAENEALIADVERELEQDRNFAVDSPMPTPESAAGGTYCEPGCHDVQPKYEMPKVAKREGKLKESEAAVHLK
ncbi:MAG: thiamine pyrophosphate-dependent dehydrogenase E1 component subunit alpha [Acidobacteriales bacterium]|nr:thiamine pyrophosphate-dependent dehydrogenase E1 component subunit alpha [Terriglobales bacterium]